MGGFVSRWVVSQSHQVDAGDLDADGCVGNATLSRWISDACAEYLELCAALHELVATSGSTLQSRPAPLPGDAARLPRPESVVVSAGVNEFRLRSFTISLRVRAIGGTDDRVFNTSCEVLVELQTGAACELGDDIRDELIALEHAARHIN